MFVTVFLVTIGFGIKFITKSNKQFFQLNSDWSKEKTIKSYGEILLDSVSYNYVKFQKESFSPEASTTYKLSNENGTYYFRYIYSINNKGTYEFKGVEWITDIPDQINAVYTIEEVYVPLKVIKGPSLMTIGDQFLIENEAKYFKKDLLNIYPVNFKGSYFDVFNFQHEAIIGNTSSNIIKQVQSIESADFYVLMYGFNDDLDSLPEFKSNTLKILKTLKTKTDKKSIFILLPPSKNEVINKSNIEKNKVLLELSEIENIELINTFLLFKEDLDKYIRDDGITISRDGYYKLAKETAKLLK